MRGGSQWPITRRLHEALEWVRDQETEKTLWIDAICINQYDLKERAQQVQLMQHIFRRAANVLVWLGRLMSDAMENFILAINKKALSNRDFRSSWSEAEVREHQDGIVEFTGLEYWHRTWIIQELALARSVHFIFGSQRFTMKDLEKGLFVALMPTALGQLLRDIRHIANASDLLSLATTESRDGNAGRLTQLLYMSRCSRCSDPRDRIYGLLGIMTNMFDADFLEADYEQSTMDVYTNFAGRLISKSGSLAILNQTEHVFNSVVGLPTWVPDWSSRFNHSYAAFRKPYHEKFNASGTHLKDTYWPAPGYTLSPKLKLCGFLFGRVRATGLCNDRRYDEVFLDWRKLYPGSAKSFSRTMVLDHFTRPADLRDIYVILQGFSAVPIGQYHPFILEATLFRRFFVSEKGLPGLGPIDTREGDSLAILAGGKVPYILRKSPNATASSPNLFTFVGEGYVDGVMYGELLEGPEAHVFEDIWLE
ncbi:uncharacterized protein A1O5_01099 [Cladophialophora psammophila CBS 110553]|uniref:Heterokaryon incompatibility domain-containing protein n=1 Tax=Cladophialophora psammophila CBS 110553 TaxID=1182543 RepID=W9XI07_9EURO|nr:uncharacterized protein A1O5_01099 [Cladophialophora psammophila CBS 110553]EXJ76591.1 hypothetical protein A1O5_01099 [Cladophialophora psammophila CBS 110553]